MVRSMTAFARESRKTRRGQWIVEIRTLNHRFFEFSLKVPAEFYAFEDRIRELIHSKISRGKIGVTIVENCEGENGKILVLDEKVAERYLKAMRKLQRRFRLESEISVKDLVSLPALFTVKESKESTEKKWNDLELTIKRTLEKILRAKQGEGQRMGRDLLSRIGSISKAVQRVEKLSAGKSKYYYEKMKSRLDYLMGEASRENDDRIWREVAILSEKSDLTEELVRMKSHLGLVKKRICSDAQVGRELDFLCQEMHREINTLGAKAQLFEISREVVFVKGELEKIREQVQNIE